MEPIHVLILSHGNFCESALHTAQLLGGSNEGVQALPMLEDQSLEEYQQSIRTVLSGLPKGSLVFLDLFGGTPFNQVAQLLREYEVYAISGFNLSMLIEAMTVRDTLQGPELVEDILEAGKNGIKNVNEFLANLS